MALEDRGELEGPHLALFDLDHTLIPFDSGLAWLGFLVRRGALPPSAESDYLACCMDYMAGQADVRDMHRALVRPLRHSTRAHFDEWLEDFETDLDATVPTAAKALVAQHREAGHRDPSRPHPSQPRRRKYTKGAMALANIRARAKG